MVKQLLIAVALIAVGVAHGALLAQRQGGAAPGGVGTALPGGGGTALPGGGGAAQPGGGGAAQPGGGGAGQPGRAGRGAPSGRQGGQPRPPRDRAEPQGTAVVRGRVVAADTGAPLRGARVEAGGNRQPSRAALTDANGRFEIRDVAAGSVVLRASKTGYVSQQFGQRWPFSPARPIVVGDGQQLTADFALPRGGVITGRVFDEFGDPVANVRVEAMRSEMTMAGRRIAAGGARAATTDDTGAFRLFSLAPGAYYVSATQQAPDRLVGPQGSITYVPTFFPGTTDPAAAQRLTIAAGVDQHNIDFGLVATSAAQVSGVVIGSSGAPIAATVTLRPALGDGIGLNRRAMSNATDGTFTLPSVPPGNYVLDVTARGRSRDVPSDVAAVPITVGGSGVTGLAVTTSRGATVTGTIVSEDGSRVDMTGIAVSAAALHPLPGRTATRAQASDIGAFTISGVAGAHVLRFDRLPSGWIVQSVNANGVDVTDRPLEYRGTEQLSVRVVLTSRTADLTGTVRADAPQGAAVLVFPEDETRWLPQSRLVRLLHAGPAGEFSVQALPRDERYIAVALDYVQNGEQYDPEFLARLRPLGRSVSFAQTEQAHVELTLQPRP